MPYLFTFHYWADRTPALLRDADELRAMENICFTFVYARGAVGRRATLLCLIQTAKLLKDRSPPLRLFD